MLRAQPASAQIQDKVIRHVKGLTPHTIHTLFEFEYFPSISGAKYGMPAVRFNIKPGTYFSITRQGIGYADGAMTSFAFGVGM